MSEDVGYIKVWRQLRQHSLWRERRRFSRLEAWLDLLLMANFKDSKILRGSRWIAVRRGQVFTSQVALAQRWGWNRKTVCSFVQALKADTMADSVTDSGADSGYTLITIQNYERYQGSHTEQLDNATDAESDTETDYARTTGGQRPVTSKKSKEDSTSQKKESGRAGARHSPRSFSASVSSSNGDRKHPDREWGR